VRASLGCLDDRVKENCGAYSAEVIAPRLEHFTVCGHKSVKKSTHRRACPQSATVEGS
jgi:hypothetical protein